MSSSRVASGSINSWNTAWLSSLPKLSIASAAGVTNSARPAPTGTDADALTRSTNTFPSTSVTVQPDLDRATNGYPSPVKPG